MAANNRQALGLIETLGYTPLVTAVDGAIKAAQVSLEDCRLTGGGLATGTVTGDVGAVKAAMDAASAIIVRLGAQGMTHVIARPDQAIWEMLRKDGLNVPDPPDNGSGGGNVPVERPEVKTPVVKEEAEVPVVRAEAKVPAERPAAKVPEVKKPSGVPVVKPEAEVPAVRPEAEVPMLQPAKNTAEKKAANSGDKAAKKVKKPRKTGGKK